MLNWATKIEWITVRAAWFGVIRCWRVKRENPTKPIDQKSSKSADWVNKQGEEQTTNVRKFLNYVDRLVVPFP